MKNKDVILDFTSLLDIVLLILFFFILYSAFNVKESEQRAEEARVEYEQMLGTLEEEKAQLVEERTQIQEEWDRIRTLDENAVKNQQALLAFNNGYMLSFHLQKEDGKEDWQIHVTRKGPASGEEERVGVILPGEDLYESILSVISSAGFTEDDVLIITFTYDGNVIGTHRLYAEIMQAFRDVQAVRKNVYLNAINLSK